MLKIEEINAIRLNERIERLSMVGKIGETGISRLALSQEDHTAVNIVKGWMEEAGMSAKIDNFGNLIGIMLGENPELPKLMIGSHIDSQVYGGRYDGVTGVIAAIEVVQTMKEKGIVPDVSIEVAAFSDEVGCRFNKGVFGVRGIWGELEEGELDRKDSEGITRRKALIDFGCNPENFTASEYEKGTLGAFLELHIEQGPILDNTGSPVGIVSGISGPLWLTLELTGFAGHAGSVPMNMRQDALLGAAKVIVALNQVALQKPGTPTVATVGNIKVFPNSRNIVPEKVTLTIDLRDIDLARREQYDVQLRNEINRIAAIHGLTCKITEDMKSEPRYVANWLKEVLREESKELGLAAPELMSGPFHNSLIMSNYCDYAMIFIRSKDGISHNPLEFSSPEDIAAGTELLYRSALRVTKQLAQ
ncbi:M20 family metallo-hydrolase [Peribacillus psychrosaccharolyticus]|uniref:M20 family metallo-hydrolase n=1 Tax=Peribacillus psychrosaccharolyticus TaxID=1407 RepID=A0A974S0W8_PERPY|nr:M20 family metallo-hydrolase [Peribacillus psychrosaccharolyticus]MEC2057220.1 M20 family metallo-hydrolase [Peribacillus psychrosaccharolyticus]MED3742951.1 M20 family metallo-hydrolase [Peribacillus psychrosaccharolyticus]QQT00984.1 M20 family metallo-hydrolase [Peribacillus psychrosaccharolyticus]